MSVAKATDDLDALRAVIEAVKDLKQDDQQRVFRWAAEKLGLPQSFGVGVPAPAYSAAAPPTGPPPAGETPGSQPGGKVQQDIKSFVAAKNPKNDQQFAATVAYFYRFLAPEAEKKAAINKDDLLEACRKVDWQRPAKALLTLNNAFYAGLLDRAEKGTFSINSVGENLVAMTLPADGSANGPATNRSRKTSVRSGKTRVRRIATKKAAKKGSAKRTRDAT